MGLKSSSTVGNLFLLSSRATLVIKRQLPHRYCSHRCVKLVPIINDYRRYQIELIVEFEPETERFTELLQEITESQSRVYLLYARYGRMVPSFRRVCRPGCPNVEKRVVEQCGRGRGRLPRRREDEPDRSRPRLDRDGADSGSAQSSHRHAGPATGPRPRRGSPHPRQPVRARFFFFEELSNENRFHSVFRLPVFRSGLQIVHRFFFLSRFHVYHSCLQTESCVVKN